MMISDTTLATTWYDGNPLPVERQDVLYILCCLDMQCTQLKQSPCIYIYIYRYQMLSKDLKIIKHNQTLWSLPPACHITPDQHGTTVRIWRWWQPLAPQVMKSTWSCAERTIQFVNRLKCWANGLKCWASPNSLDSILITTYINIQ